MTYFKYRVRVIRHKTENGTHYDYYNNLSKDIVCTGIEIKNNSIIFYDNAKILDVYPSMYTVVNKL